MHTLSTKFFLLG